MREIHFHTPSGTYRFGASSASFEQVKINRHELQPVNRVRLLRALALGQAFRHGWVDAFQAAARAGDIDPDTVSEEEIEAAEIEHGDREHSFVSFSWAHTTGTGRTHWDVLADGSVFISVYRPSHEVRRLRVLRGELIDIRAQIAQLGPERQRYSLASEGLCLDYLGTERPQDLEELDTEWRTEIATKRGSLSAKLIELGQESVMRDGEILMYADDNGSLANLDARIEELRKEEEQAKQRGDQLLVLRIVVNSEGAPGPLTWTSDAEARHYEDLRKVLRALDTDLQPGQVPARVQKEMARLEQQGALEQSMAGFFGRLALYLAGGTVKTENPSFQALADDVCEVLERYQVLDLRTMEPEVRSLWHYLNAVAPNMPHVGPHEIHTRTAMDAHRARLDVLKKREDLYTRGALLANKPDLPESGRRRGGLHGSQTNPNT